MLGESCDEKLGDGAAWDSMAAAPRQAGIWVRESCTRGKQAAGHGTDGAPTSDTPDSQDSQMQNIAISYHVAVSYRKMLKDARAY